MPSWNARNGIITAALTETALLIHPAAKPWRADFFKGSVGAEGMDGFVAIGGCDKNMPGAMMAIARLSRPAVFVYGGKILPGCITMNSPSAMNYNKPVPPGWIQIASKRIQFLIQ